MRNLIGLTAAIAACFALSVSLGRTESGAEATIDDPDLSAQIDELNRTIKDKREAVQDVQGKIGEYKALIAKKQAEAVTLADQVGLLENRMAESELDIRGNEQEIGLVNDELALVEKEIRGYEAQLERDRSLMAEILRTMDVSDGDVLLNAVFSTDSIADLLDQLAYLANVNDELSTALTRARDTRDALVGTRTVQEGKKARLNELQASLIAKRRGLEEEKGAKEALLIESKDSEAEYRALLSKSREEEAYISQQIAKLQGEIEDRITEHDDIGDSSLMSWPVDASYKGISTTFHDPTYPFRHLFEHSGLDIPQKQGTPVGSAAPGYVAWTRVGSMYGNYVMVIHKNGLATLYAHLSKVSVKADQFVARGQTIGFSGGTPGTQGAGLSTGPHLHFEVRKKGVPVNPMPYMVSEP